MLAAFRYVFLICKASTNSVSIVDHSLFGVFAVVIFCAILCIPSYIEHRIVSTVSSNDSSLINQTIYRFDETTFSRYLSLRHTVFVLHSVMFKLIPCMLLLLFSFLLIQQLRDALATAEKLQKHTRARAGRRREKENRRTTLMLVIVCLLFLITELPQGAILLLTFLSKSNSKFYFQIYQQLGL